MDDKNNLKLPEYEFHYNRDERLSMLPESVIKMKNTEQGIFKNNRSMVILLLDILLICLLSLGFLIYQRISSNRFSTEDYSFTLKSFIYDEKILISISALNKSSSNPGSKDTSPLPVDITVRLSKISEFYKKIYDFLPDQNNRTSIYRVSIPLDKIPPVTESSFVIVTLKFRDNTIKLKHKLVNEK